MLRIGIVGLAQAGKTTLFTILTHAHGTGLGSGRPEAHMSVVRVPDARLDRLSEMYHRKKTIHATVEYVDTPGSIIELARTGAQAATLREMDALAFVVKAFDQASPTDPSSLKQDIENVQLELILSDLAVIEKRLERLEKDIKKQKNPELEKEHHTLLLCKQTLERQRPLRELQLEPGQELAIRGFTFLTLKPVLYVLNVGESEAAVTTKLESLAVELGLSGQPKTAVSAVCGKVESELAELPEEEAAEFLASYGLAESAATRLIRSSYKLLGLISFFTVGDYECRAWTIRSGTTALDAAGEVHTDFQRGFIRAEVVKYEDLIASGGLAEARAHALLKLEGKDYVIQDGEVVYFRHSG